MGWFFSFGTNASVLSCNNVGHCHFYRRLLICIPSLRAHDLARPHHRSCAVAPVRWVVGSQRSRKTVAMFSKQEQRTWIKIQCMPYSPDISPCDYDLIPKMKMPMRGKRYHTIEDVKQAAERSLRTINRLGSANGIQRLPRRWEHVVHNGGDYIEGPWNLEPSWWAIYPVITLVSKLKNQPMYLYNLSKLAQHLISCWHQCKRIYREISIAFDSKCRLCAVGRRRLMHGPWYVPWFNCIWVRPTHSWFVVRLWFPHELVLAWFSSCIECMYKCKLYNA